MFTSIQAFYSIYIVLPNIHELLIRLEEGGFWLGLLTSPEKAVPLMEILTSPKMAGRLGTEFDHISLLCDASRRK